MPRLFGSVPGVKLTGGNTGLIVLVCEPKPLRPFQPATSADYCLFVLVCDAAILELQENWDADNGPDWMAEFAPMRSSPLPWTAHGTPAAAFGYLLAGMLAKPEKWWRGNAEKEGADSGVREACLASFDKIFRDKDPAETARFVSLCERWLRGVPWRDCFYSETNRPSLATWSGSPCECLQLDCWTHAY